MLNFLSVCLRHTFHGPRDPVPGEKPASHRLAFAGVRRLRPPLSEPSTMHISAQFGPCAYERFTPSCAPFETPLSNLSKWRHYADHARRLYADP
jgi:hypothetical protein